MFLFGAYALFLRRGWRWVLTPAIMSLAWWFVSTDLVMVKSRIAMEELQGFFQTFGSSHNEVVATFLKRPGTVLSLILNKSTFAYLYEIGKPAAMMPLFSIASIFMLPTLAVNTLIGAFMIAMRSTAYHY